MKYNPDIHHRRSIRLREYDYAAAGAYFVTICAQGRACLFGEIRDHAMVPNAAGRMLVDVWRELSVHYAGVDVDTHVVMPNHFHGIIILTVGAGPRACPDFTGPRGRPEDGHPEGGGHPQGGAPTLSLFDVVHRFKSLTTARYRHGVRDDNWPPFPGRLWQRNYYERVIRDDAELIAIREYIRCNPERWLEDKEHPEYARNGIGPVQRVVGHGGGKIRTATGGVKFGRPRGAVKFGRPRGAVKFGRPRGAAPTGHCMTDHTDMGTNSL